MSIVPTRDDELLRTQISQAQEKQSGLQHDLRSIDDQLGGLSEQRAQYELLDRVCSSLEQLDAAGAAELFWGDAGEIQAEGRVREARDRIGAFRQRLDEIEDRRHAVLDRIRDNEGVLDILEGDLVDLELEEEDRKREWIPERDILPLPVRPTIMPWSRGEDDRRFRKSLSTTLLAALLVGAIVPSIDLPLPPLDLLPEVPDRFARLIEQRALPPPPPPAVIEEPPPEPVEPEPIVAEELPTEVPEVEQAPAPTVAEETAPAPAPTPEPVRPAGILAFRESFSSLADSRQAAALGAEARINNAGESAVGRTERSMVTTQAPGSSGGINLASLSRDVGGGGAGPDIGGVDLARVASSIGPAGTSDRPLSGGAAAGRTDEEIQIVFDRYKAALYRLYNRELRNDPTLRGQIVLQLTIEADGRVSFCEVRSSDMNAPALEQQVVERVLTFDFGAKDDITAITILYPIDFLPAA